LRTYIDLSQNWSRLKRHYEIQRDWKTAAERGIRAMADDDRKPVQDHDASILNFDVDDTAIELAATGVGTIPTASVNMVPPNCCVQQKH
jgi:hypothetical protein